MPTIVASLPQRPAQRSDDGRAILRSVSGSAERCAGIVNRTRPWVRPTDTANAPNHRRVGTHLDVHVAAALDERGAQLGVESFAATAAGDRELLVWLEGFGTLELVGVEGTGSYGAGLTRHLLGHQVAVVEVDRPNRRRRRRTGKSDPHDPQRAPRSRLSADLSHPVRTELPGAPSLPETGLPEGGRSWVGISLDNSSGRSNLSTEGRRWVRVQGAGWKGGKLAIVGGG